MKKNKDLLSKQLESDVSFAGTPSPSHGGTRPSDAGGLQRNQTLGQKIMGNIVRSFTSKPVNFTSDANVPSSPSKVVVQFIVLQVHI